MRKLHRSKRSRWLLALVVAAQSGCGIADKMPPGPHDTRTSYHDTVGLKIEYPEVSNCTDEPPAAAVAATEPLAFQDPAEVPALEMQLEEAVRLAVSNNPAVRTLNSTLLQAPQQTATVYDPALAHANPLGGVEAALSAFDAQYSGQLFWTKVDQPNNVQLGGLGALFNPPALQETNATFRQGLTKQTAQGGQFALRNVVNYNNTNRPFRQFTSDFVGFLEAEWRQPLMQGAGTYYNQIAGPNAPLGQYNGVLIARINEDVSLANFEASVVNLVADVEEAYWNLHQAYRLLEAGLRGREAALQTYQYQQVRLDAGVGRRDEAAQARSQFFQFQAQVQNALAGPTGLYALEQRLRYLIGYPATDGRLIKPTSDPLDVKVVFDWDSALGQALTRRVEIRRQKFNVRRRELELVAARMNRRPRLDFLGQYRWRGLGDNLIGDADPNPLDNLASSITSGDYQEWQAGFELSFPVGLRAASAAVAHARLSVARERSVLQETELRISHDLSAAARDVERAYTLLETNYYRWQADLQQFEVLQRRYVDGTDNINFLLQAQRQLVTSESDFYRSVTDYNLAIRNLHREKGTLLAYNQVYLGEGPWAAGALGDAYERGRFFHPRRNPQAVDAPPPVARGEFNPTQVVDTSPQVGIAGEPQMIDQPEPMMDAPVIVQPPSGEALPGGGTIPSEGKVIPSEAPNEIPVPLRPAAVPSPGPEDRASAPVALPQTTPGVNAAPSPPPTAANQAAEALNARSDSVQRVLDRYKLR